MNKKTIRSSLLSLFVVAITVAAFGGMTVWAAPETASFDIDPDTYTLTHSGYSDIGYDFASINYGTVNYNGQSLTTNGLSLTFHAGTLTCGDNEIPFYVSRNTHDSTSSESVYLSFGKYSNNSFGMSVYIDPQTYRSVPAGTYTGTMTYTSIWRTSSTSVDGASGSVELTLVVPAQDENILEYGTFGSFSWTFDRSGTLTISGTGNMGDFKMSDTPWQSCNNEIKDVVIADGITSIGEYAFLRCYLLESISLPDSLKTIGDDAFNNCNMLELASLPDGITAIGTNAFRACEKITLTALPSDLSTLGEYAFAYCSGIESVTIPGSLETIERSAFSCCYGLKEVVISDGVKTIGHGAFGSCGKLASITIADSVETIDRFAFEYAGITNLVLPSSLTTIRDYAFQGCKGITEVTIPSGVDTIGDNAFQNSGLKSVVISEGVKGIGRSTFYRCQNLTTVALPSTLTKIGSSAFEDCGLTAVEVPGTVTEFGEAVFISCSDLKTVVLHEGLTTIPARTFYKCFSLKTIGIPSTVTEIGENAFIGCSGLDEFNCFADPSVLTWTDGGCNDFRDDGQTKCRVPFYDLDTYKGKFSTGNTDTDVNVVFISNYDDVGLGDILYGFTVSLEGDIGVNFFVEFKNYDALSDNAQMVFTIKSLDGTSTRTQKVYVKPQSDSSLPCAQYYGGYYIFKCNVTSKEMTSTITAQIVDGEYKGKENSYSVQEYAAYILANPDTTGFADAQDLVKAMLNYGAYSQIYFDYNTGNLANSILKESDKDVSGVTAESITHYGIFKNNMLIPKDGGVIICDSVSLSLESKTKMNIFFRGDLENVYFMCGNKRLSASVTSDGAVRVSVDGIAAQNINELYTITLYRNGNELGSISYSPVNYCYNVLNRELSATRTAELKNVVRALYLFNQEADAYIDSLSA